MIQAVATPIEPFYKQIKGLARVREQHSARFSSNLDEFLVRANCLYDSLFTSEETNHFRVDDRRNLYSSNNVGQRNYRVIISEPLGASFGSELDDAIVKKDLHGIAWTNFSDLLHTLNFLIKLRLDLSPKHHDVTLQHGNQEFIRSRSEFITKVITCLVQTIKEWTENLSAASKDFIEIHINAHHAGLAQLKQVYEHASSEFPVNFRTVLGFDKLPDGSPRELKVSYVEKFKQRSVSIEGNIKNGKCTLVIPTLEGGEIRVKATLVQEYKIRGMGSFRYQFDGRLQQIFAPLPTKKK